MLPAHLAENIRKQILFYLQSMFDFQDTAVGAALEQFMLAPHNGTNFRDIGICRVNVRMERFRNRGRLKSIQRRFPQREIR